MTDISNDEDARLALLRAAKWRDEIERAVDGIKKSANRSKSDRRFRKLWHIAEARLKKNRQVGNHWARRRQISEHGGGENGKAERIDGRPLGPAGRPAWNDAVFCGPALAAVQERAEAARILGIRE